MGKGLAYGAAFIMGMILLRDGTLPAIIQDASKTVVDGVKGLKPITKVA